MTDYNWLRFVLDEVSNACISGERSAEVCLKYFSQIFENENKLPESMKTVLKEKMAKFLLASVDKLHFVPTPSHPSSGKVSIKICILLD